MTDDTELQSTVARVLERELEPGGIGDLHAELEVLRSRLREAMEVLRPFAEAAEARVYDKPEHEWLRIGGYTKSAKVRDYRRAAALVARLDHVKHKGATDEN